jgi:serine/threonine-protein kinase RsbW
MDVFGYPDETIRKMKVALTELLVNAIHHGNGRDFTKKVLVGHVVDGKQTVVSIMDEGRGFAPDAIPDPTLPENLNRDCGRGLYIVRHYVDKIEHGGKGNRVTITKYHPYG